MINYKYIFKVEPNAFSDALNDTEGLFCLFPKAIRREE